MLRVVLRMAGRSRRPLLALAVLGLVLSAPACSRGKKPVHRVQGRVLLRGRPAARATVTFHPVGADADAVRPSGQTDDQGYFTLTTYAGGDGAPEGEYRVSLVWLLPTPVPGSAGDYEGRNYLPPRYANAETSGLRVTVARGENKLQPFDLR